MDGYLVKPLDKILLRQTLEKCLLKTESESIVTPHKQPYNQQQIIEQQPLLDQKTIGDIIESAGIEALRDIIAAFIPDAKNLIQALEQALQDNNHEHFKLTIHSLKGSSGMAGAFRLHCYTKNLDAITKQGQWLDEDWLSHLKNIYHDTKEAFDKL